MSPAGPPVSNDWHRRYGRILLVSDTLVLVWVFLTAHVAWAVNRADQVAPGGLSPYASGPVVLSVVLLLLWLAVLDAAGTRDPVVLGAGPEEYKRIVSSSITWFAIVAFFAYVVQLAIPRSYVVVSVVFGVVLLVLTRWSWRQWLVVRRRAGQMTSNTLVVGNREAVERIAGVVGRSTDFGYRMIGACVPAADPHQLGAPDAPDLVGGLPVLGEVDAVAKVVSQGGVDAVLVASTDATHADMVRQLGWELESYDVALIVAPSLANIAGPRVHVRPVAGLPLLHVEEPAYRGSERYTKGVLDRAGSLALLMAFSPVFLATALAIKLDSRGSVFFRQERVGRNGQVFGMIKFRSMVPGAEQMVTELEGDSGNEVMFKMRDDPRVTRVGSFIRRFSVDELPQLINVLKGDMSLVGPRPPLASEVSGYGDDARRRLLVRPGMTGLWQISGRSNLDWEETVRLDLYYVENWSIVGDLLILWKTARAVVTSNGAY